MGLSPFPAVVPNDFGPVSAVADERGLAYHGRERRTFSVFADPPRAQKRFPVVSWGPREDTFVPAESFCGNCEAIADHDDRIVYRCNGHPSRELRADRRLRRRAKYRDPVVVEIPDEPSGIEAIASDRRDADYDPDACGSSDPPPGGVAGGGSGDRGGGVLALLDGSDADGMPPPPAPPPLDGPEVAVEDPLELVPCELEEDYWGPHLGRMAWARIHVQARNVLQEPTLHGHDSAGG